MPHPVHNKKKMADGRHFEKIEKLPYLSNGLTNCHEIRHEPCRPKKTKAEPKQTSSLKNCSYVCAYHCVQLSYTAQDSSDNLPSYPPDSHHCIDAVY